MAEKKRKTRSDKGKKRGPKKRSYARRAYSYVARRKPKQRGLIGKAGAVTAGVLPVVIPTVEAASAAWSAHKKGFSALSTVYYGVLRYCNNITNGLFGVEAFDEPVTMYGKDGQESLQGIKSGVPSYALGKVIITGVGMMATDWLASMFAGGRSVKIPGTNYNAIGST